MRRHFLVPLFICGALLLVARTAHAGHETPSYIDGCQSVDGRFVITASLAKEATQKTAVHGPFDWQFTWKDTKTNTSRTFPAQGLQRAQIHAQLYIAPDGESFALFNHVTMVCDQSHMHGPPGIRAAWEGKKTFPDRPEFERRVIVYRKDGSIVKTIGAKDILTSDEWASVVPFFNRVHWLKEYDGLHFKMTPRMSYALHRVSPDYTILEVTVVPVRGAKEHKLGRVVRISLTDGKVLAPKDWPTATEKVPVRPFVGIETVKNMPALAKDDFVPSLDPVRTAGVFNTPPSESPAKPK